MTGYNDGGKFAERDTVATFTRLLLLDRLPTFRAGTAAPFILALKEKNAGDSANWRP